MLHESRVIKPISRSPHAGRNRENSSNTYAGPLTLFYLVWTTGYHDTRVSRSLYFHESTITSFFFLSVVSSIHKRLHMRMETSNAGGLFAGKIGIFESFVELNPLTLQQPDDFHM